MVEPQEELLYRGKEAEPLVILVTTQSKVERW